jgi:hypothetical protein
MRMIGLNDQNVDGGPDVTRVSFDFSLNELFDCGACISAAFQNLQSAELLSFAIVADLASAELPMHPAPQEAEYVVKT